MALDSAGYNTANAFSANNALATGLQQAAVYDPTTQNSTMSTSVAGKLNSQNTLQQDGADGSQNLLSTVSPTGGTLSNASNNQAFPMWSGISKLATQTQSPTDTSSANTAQVAATGQVPVAQTALQQVPSSAQSFVNPAGQSKLATAINANGGQTQQTNYLPGTGAISVVNAAQTAANVNPYVAVRTSDGNFAYYHFAQTYSNGVWGGYYAYAGTYNASGQSVDGSGSLTAAQRQSATLQQLGAGQTFKTDRAGVMGDQVTQYNSAAITAYKAGATAAVDNYYKSQNDLQTSQLLQYMEANGGKLPPGLLTTTQAIDSNLGSKNNNPFDIANGQFTIDNVNAAKSQYQDYLNTRSAEDANAATLGAYANKPIDTAAVDATSQAAVNAYNSIGASQGGGDSGAGSRLGAQSGSAIAGQGALNHQNAAAQSYLTNMQAFGQALQAQATTDANATATKLNSDVQNVQDVASALEQNLSQLDTKTQMAVKGQLDNLNNLIAQYQYAMQHYKDNTALIHKLAVAVLAVGGAIATAATGGLAGVAIAAGTAAASAAASKA